MGEKMADRYCMHNELMNDFIDKNFEGIRAPFTAGFELTAKCNLNCVHCYAKPDREHRDFTLDLWTAILRGAKFLRDLILKICLCMQRKKAF